MVEIREILMLGFHDEIDEIDEFCEIDEMVEIDLHQQD